ncbi:TorF family putative porin [Sphingomonas sp. RS2018]
MRIGMIGAAALLTLAAQPALAQDLSAGVEATTDERRRGISWSDGDPALSADAIVGVAGFDLSARAVTLRGSPRHAGADAVVDVELSKRFAVGPIDLRARGIGHLFAGADAGMDYVELGGSGSYTLGPAQLTVGALYAPDQGAIGGDNVYLSADANVGVPATPFSLRAGVGRSSGSVDDPLRATRLRPGGNYTDWRVGVDYSLPLVTLSLDYVGTDIEDRAVISPFADARNVGERLVARARVSF